MNVRLSLIVSLALGIASISALIALGMHGVAAMLVGILASISISLFALTLMTQSFARNNPHASTSNAQVVDDLDEEREPAALAG